MNNKQYVYYRIIFKISAGNDPSSWLRAINSYKREYINAAGKDSCMCVYNSFVRYCFCLTDTTDVLKKNLQDIPF